MFTELVKLHGAAELATVHRQRQAYQAKASEDFARGDIHAALAAYDSRGQIIWCDSLADARDRAVAAQASITGPGFLYASTNKEVEALNRAEQARRRADLTAAGQKIDAHQFKTVRGEVSIAAGERVQFYETDRKLGVATSEFGTVKAVSPGRMEIAKDDGTAVTLDPTKYDKWGLGYSGTGYKGQGKTQVKTAAVYDNPYAWDSRASYVIGTRHRDEYQLFVPRDLAPDLATLSGQIMRQREDRGSSLRFEAVAARGPRQGLDGEDARQKLSKALDHGREVLTAAKARAAIEAERQRQVEKLNQGHRLGRGPRLGR
jgi:ATP-dependent exoDNAse (exonuclease V) alpha subunit